MSLEKYFEKYRDNIIGKDQTFDSPFGQKKIIYADWIASGRLYSPIENLLRKEIFPFVANTHTETSTTGASMSFALEKALDLIKKHVGGNSDDIVISAGEITAIGRGFTITSAIPTLLEIQSLTSSATTMFRRTGRQCINFALLVFFNFSSVNIPVSSVRSIFP